MKHAMEKQDRRIIRTELRKCSVSFNRDSRPKYKSLSDSSRLKNRCHSQKNIFTIFMRKRPNCRS